MAAEQGLFYSLLILCILSKSDSISPNQIERLLTSKGGAPYSATDTFRNHRDRFCSSKVDYCLGRSAKCLSVSNCCGCKCLPGAPNFHSYEKGCFDTNVASGMSGTTCQFTVKESASVYVPTFSNYLDFTASIIELQLKNAAMSALFNSGTCTSSTIYYIRSNGKKASLFENKCSEVIEISSKSKPNGGMRHRLFWTYKKGVSVVAWRKMKGKLLLMDISCMSPSLNKSVSSCLLFKVAGQYNDNRALGAKKSPAVCPILTPPVAKPTTTTRRTRARIRTESSTRMHIATQISILVHPATLTEYKPASTSRNRITTTPQPSRKPSNEAISDTEEGVKLSGLVTGLIIAVLFLLFILAVAISVLLRKRCRKRRMQDERAQNPAEPIPSVTFQSRPTLENANYTPSKNAIPEVSASEENLYESIDEFHVRAAARPERRDFLNAVNSGEGAKIGANCRILNQSVQCSHETDGYQQPLPTSNKVVNQPAINKHVYQTPEVYYTDMSIGEPSDTCPLVDDGRRYSNVDSIPPRRGSKPGQPVEMIYEDANATGSAEKEPLVAEAYVEPDVGPRKH